MFTCQKANVKFADSMTEWYLQRILQIDLSYQDWKVRERKALDHTRIQIVDANGLDHSVKQGLRILVKQGVEKQKRQYARTKRQMNAI